MGGFTTIRLKETSQDSITKANAILDKMKVAKQYRFYSENDVILKYEYYKKGDGNYPEDLFPTGKINSYEDFTKYWSTEALGETFVPKFGTLTFDCYYGRTSQTTINKLSRFVYNNRNLIGEVDGSYTTFVDKCDLPTKKKDILIKMEEPFEPEMLPEKEQYRPNLQSGQWLCKSWSNTPFWVIYGNVKSPRFLKEKIYVNDIYNNHYKDKKGYAYLLMPLMPLDAGDDWFGDLIDRMLSMGMREHPHFILPILYGVSCSNPNEIAENFKEYYTQEEIKERFELLYNNMVSDYGYNQVHGFVWSQKDSKFVPCGSKTSTIMSKCELLTMLLDASNANEFSDLLNK